MTAFFEDANAGARLLATCRQPTTVIVILLLVSWCGLVAGLLEVVVVGW